MEPRVTEPTREIARRQRVESFIRGISKHNLHPLVAEPGRSYSIDDPDYKAMYEIAGGYNEGDIDIDGVLEYYEVVRPYVTTNQLPVRDVDVEAFKKIAIGEVVLVNNKVQTVQGRNVDIDVYSKLTYDRREDEGFGLAVSFDTTQHKISGLRRDVTVSLHHLADNIFVGEDSISRYLSEIDPIVLSKDNWRKHIDGFASSYNNDEASQAHGNLALLNSIIAHEDIAMNNPEAIQKLINVTTANTKFVLGLDAEKPTGMRVFDGRTFAFRDRDYQKTRDFVDVVRELDPAAYEKILDIIGGLVAKDPGSEMSSQYVRFIAWVSQPAYERTSQDIMTEKGRIDGVSVAEIVPVFNDLMLRGQLAS